ncbi:hypothetical protein D3C85_1257930 [compost metagenome]
MAPGVFPSAIPPQEGCRFVSPRNIGPGNRRCGVVHRTRDGGRCRSCGLTCRLRQSAPATRRVRREGRGRGGPGRLMAGHAAR